MDIRSYSGKTLLLSALCLFLTACQHRPATPPIEIVIPKDCITSDILCTQYNGKKMDCKFDKFTACEVIKVAP